MRVKVPLIFLLSLPAVVDAQVGMDTIRGRVTGSGHPIAGAVVAVTVPPERTSLTTRTADDGTYIIRVANGPGDYLVHVNAIGWKPFRRRIQRSGNETSFAVDADLVSIAAELARITVTARPPRPQRGLPAGPEPAAAEAVVEGVNALLEPAAQGDIAALANALPGTVLTDAGPSALGVDPGQNGVTVNGLAFMGAALPREASTRSRVATSTYDVARGGFGGLQTSVDINGGGLYSTRRAHITLDSPALQYTDRVSAQLGQRFTGGQISAGADGELSPDRLYYSVAAQVGRRVSDVASFGTLGPTGWQRLGVSPDSASRLVGILTQLGVPPNGQLPLRHVRDNYSVLARFDRTPTGRSAVGLVLLGQHSGDNISGAAPASALSRTTTAQTDAWSAQLIHSLFLTPGVLTATRTSLSRNRSRKDPRLVAPAGRVLLPATLANDELGAVPVNFGGAAGNSASNGWSWEINNETQWYAGRGHRLKLYGDMRLDQVDDAYHFNPFGTFAFASPADLLAGRATSFSRMLGDTRASGENWTGALGLGDLWRVAPRFQLLYGARVEGTRFTSRLQNNETVTTTLGIRTDARPSEWHVSPRAGFTWYLSGLQPTPYRTGTSSLGTRTFGPTGVLRGGIGEFRSALPVSLLEPAQIFTGLPGAPRSLRCIGTASPTPVWKPDLAESSPIDCAGGGASQALVDTTQTVQLFSPHYVAPRSWRANLAWSSVLAHVAVTIDGSYSLNEYQPSTTDLNFDAATRGVLPAEANRPLYGDPALIDTMTGQFRSGAARRSSTLGAVVEHDSRGLSVGRQITITAAPELNFGRYRLAVSYTLGEVRRRANGFDSPTLDNPLLNHWGPGNLDVRHQVEIQGGVANSHVAVTLFARVMSGLPFTPLVGSDINGDGVANDPAFVFAPSAAPDSSVREAMRALSTTAPRGVRECLERQFGQLAGINSCRGPWTTSLNLQATLLGDPFHTRNRMRMTLNVANPLAAIDQLVHGEANVHGWGQQGVPDPVLLYVRGFDATPQQYRYVVNSRFGTGDTRRLVRAPFRITLDVALDLGTPFAKQELEQALAPGRARPGPRLTADLLQRRYQRDVPDLYDLVLAQSDSLLLTPQQIDTLRVLQQQYRQQVDSVWADLAGYLVALPVQYSTAEAFRRQEQALDRAWEITQADAAHLKAVLSPAQLRLAPRNVQYVVNATSKVRLPAFGP